MRVGRASFAHVLTLFSSHFGLCLWSFWPSNVVPIGQAIKQGLATVDTADQYSDLHYGTQL